MTWTPTRITLVLVLFIVMAPCILVFIILGWVFDLVGTGVSWASNALRGVGTRRDDPVFGPVTYQGYSLRRTERDLDALGGRLVIEVPGRGQRGRTTPTMSVTAQNGEKAQHNIARQAEESIFREYQAVAPNCRQQLVVGNDWLSKEYRTWVPVLEESAPDLDTAGRWRHHV